MTAIKSALIVFVIALAVLSVAGCLGQQDDRDQLQDNYDNLVIKTNNQIATVQNVSNQQNLYAMNEPMMKAWLIEYRSQVAILQDDMNATNDAGTTLKTYLTPGSSDYSTMETNEQTLQQHLSWYVGDYNKNAGGYNEHWGPENGTVALL